MGQIKSLVNVGKCPIQFWERTISFLERDHHFCYAHLPKPMGSSEDVRLHNLNNSGFAFPLSGRLMWVDNYSWTPLLSGFCLSLSTNPFGNLQ